ncbi:MAG: radical SAM protein [Candidatus Nanoarchaeia archaeon]|nr:radical SAM protein [Candidatus Nanoarchaeia archaeon]MDD5358129.1 radical SAM protein [Candidatus Nanoarchaeia archaeon]MDD5589316.1 radical SAM protein [Candidatus Nanoarchaeia archaeon]
MRQDLYSQYKLLKHLDRLIAWRDGEIVYPIAADFNLTNKCNNRCPLCVSSESRDNTTVNFEDAKRIIQELKDVGTRSIYFAGGGDPTCHENLEEIIRLTKSKDMDVAVCTNGYKMSDGVIDAIVDCCSWMRISLDADGPEIYKRTHGMSKDSFYRVIENMSKLAIKKREKNSEIVIGAAYLLGPETVSGIYNAAELCKKIGIDGIRFRPFFEWMNSEKFPEKEREIMLREFEFCNRLKSNNFSVSYPEDRLQAVVTKKIRHYDKCYVPHVITAISADLKLYPCCVLRNNPKYVLGDLKEKSFREIWESDERRKVHEKIDVNDCPNPCQYEKDNKIMHAVIEKITHSNFL